MLTPHDFQEEGIQRIVSFFSTATQGQHDLIASPTGTGKGVVLIHSHNRLMERDATGYYVLCPTDEIIQGLWEKGAGDGAVYSKHEAECHGYYTFLRFRNELLRGSIPPPRGLLIDEGHHWDNDTQELVDALTANAPFVLLTATPFRGSMKANHEFRKRYGVPHWLITLPEAVRRGFCAFPTCSIVPLLDDDLLTVVGNDFTVKSTEDATVDVLDRLVTLMRPWYGDHWDRATMLSLPSVYAARVCAAKLNEAGLPADCVVGDSTPEERAAAFQRCVEGKTVLVQVRVISEGVDLPVRRLVDLSPTMSPVKWQQQFGRVTRPTDTPPEYICTNRNLLRHCYLLEGLLPPAVYLEGAAAFPPPQRRMVRAVGFEGLGKFREVEVPLANGTPGQLICIQCVGEDNRVHQYCALASPLHGEVIYAERVNTRNPDPTKNDYARWVACDAIPDIMNGYSSTDKGTLTPAMKKWWDAPYGAAAVGLDASVVPNRRSFTALPVLKDTGRRFR